MFRLVVLGKNEAVAALVANEEDVAVEAKLALVEVVANDADVAILAVDALDTLLTVTASVVPSPWLKVIVALVTDELK